MRTYLTQTDADGMDFVMHAANPNFGPLSKAHMPASSTKIAHSVTPVNLKLAGIQHVRHGPSRFKKELEKESAGLFKPNISMESANSTKDDLGSAIPTDGTSNRVEEGLQSPRSDADSVDLGTMESTKGAPVHLANTDANNHPTQRSTSVADMRNLKTPETPSVPLDPAVPVLNAAFALMKEVLLANQAKRS